MQTTQRWTLPSPVVVPPTPSDERVLREMGARIRRLRKLKGMNQTELARRVGVRQETVSQWESGLLVMSVLHARALAKALGITLSDLVR